MEYRRLGKSALMVSEVSFGGHQTGGYHGKFQRSPEERTRVIERGLELGITYFDTTTSWEVDSLSSVFGLLGGKPDDITVTCMFTDYKLNHDVVAGIEDKVRQSIEFNLQHFAPIDVFNLCGDGLPYSQERTLRVVGVLEQAREKGEIKQFGFSTHTMHYALNMIENHPEFTLIMFPFNRVLPRIAEILFPVASQHDVAVVGMKAVAARGFFNLDIDPAKYGENLSLPIAAIKWVLQHSEVSCTIPAMNSIAEVEENVRASGDPLTPAELDLLDGLFQAFDTKVSTDPKWYFHRDWTRRLYGEGELQPKYHNPFE